MKDLLLLLLLLGNLAPHFRSFSILNSYSVFGFIIVPCHATTISWVLEPRWVGLSGGFRSEISRKLTAYVSLRARHGIRHCSVRYDFVFVTPNTAHQIIHFLFTLAHLSVSAYGEQALSLKSSLSYDYLLGARIPV